MGELDPLLVLDMALSFLFGGAMVTAVTIISEKLGHKIGGIIAGLPVPLAISLFFQALILDVNQVAQASAPAALISLSTMGIFIIIYMFACRWGGVTAVGCASLVWLGMAVIIKTLSITSMPLAIGVFVVIAMVSKAVLFKMKSGDAPPTVRLKATKRTLLVRFIAVGSIVLLSVMAGLFAGPVWGGLIAMYPVMVASSLLILQRSMGADFSRNFAQSYFSSAIVNLSLYIVGVHYFYPLYGIWLGTLLAYIAPICSAILLYKFDSFFKKALKASDEHGEFS